jgi:hypothetical protein
MTTYYAGVKVLTSSGTITDMHTTVWFKHDASEDDLQHALSYLTSLNLTGRNATITDYDNFNGIEVCLLDIGDLQSSLVEFNNTYSWRRSLKKQYDFQLHVSMGNPNTAEYFTNKQIIDANGGVGSKLRLGVGYVKNLDTKRVECIF